MLVRLMYASRAVGAVEHDDLAAILKQAKARNAGAGITGLLCYCAGSNTFMQALEGGRAQVNALYNRIAQDERHTDVVLLGYDEIRERRFAGWSMGQVNMSRLNAAQVLKYAETATLDAFSMSGAAAMALFEDLVATASVMGER
jgi:hypothetical protein